MHLHFDSMSSLTFTIAFSANFSYPYKLWIEIYGLYNSPVNQINIIMQHTGTTNMLLAFVSHQKFCTA